MLTHASPFLIQAQAERRGGLTQHDFQSATFQKVAPNKSK